MPVVVDEEEEEEVVTKGKVGVAVVEVVGVEADTVVMETCHPKRS